MKTLPVVVLSFLLASSAYTFGKKPSQPEKTAKSPIDFSAGTVTVQCVVNSIGRSTADSSWHPVVDPATGFAEDQGTARFQAYDVTAGQTVLVFFGSDGWDESTQGMVTYTQEPGGKPYLLFKRVQKSDPCPSFEISGSQFTFRGWTEALITTTPAQFAYSAKVSNLKNHCGQGGQWLGGLGSMISYQITCSVGAKTGVREGVR